MASGVVEKTPAAAVRPKRVLIYSARPRLRRLLFSKIVEDQPVEGGRVRRQVKRDSIYVQFRMNRSWHLSSPVPDTDSAGRPFQREYLTKAEADLLREDTIGYGVEYIEARDLHGLLRPADERGEPKDTAAGEAFLSHLGEFSRPDIARQSRGETPETIREELAVLSLPQVNFDLDKYDEWQSKKAQAMAAALARRAAPAGVAR